MLHVYHFLTAACEAISINVSIKLAAGLGQALIILQCNGEAACVKWEVSNIFLESIAKFTLYASFAFTRTFTVCFKQATSLL